jgi:hypothetical protein
LSSGSRAKRHKKRCHPSGDTLSCTKSGYFFAGVSAFFSVVPALSWAQQDFEAGQLLSDFMSHDPLESFFSVDVEVVDLVVVVVVEVDLAGVCGVCAKAMLAIRKRADTNTIDFFIAICFWFGFALV